MKIPKLITILNLAPELQETKELLSGLSPEETNCKLTSGPFEFNGLVISVSETRIASPVFVFGSDRVDHFETSRNVTHELRVMLPNVFIIYNLPVSTLICTVKIQDRTIRYENCYVTRVDDNIVTLNSAFSRTLQ